MNIRRKFLASLMLLVTFGSMATLTQAAPKGPLPKIDTISLAPSGPFSPGTDLTFTVEGTPRGKASIRITGAKKSIPLTEIDAGVYEGEYTVSSRDRFTPATSLRATLTVRARSVSMSQSLGKAAGAPVAAPTPPAPPVQAAPLEIQRFTGKPIARIEAGEEMHFMLTGTPGARAYFIIDGVSDKVLMQEARPGHYEGVYVVRRRDQIPPAANVVAWLESGSKRISQRLNNSVVDVQPPSMRNISPRNGEIVTANPVVISATFGDRRGVGVDAASVRIKIGGNDATGSATITPHLFTLRTELRPGNYPVEVTARDLAGNVMREAWAFTVAASGAPVATVMPLDITSHPDGAEVRGGTIAISGRTAPDARVDLQIKAVGRFPGSQAMNSQSTNQVTRANANGFYAFNFEPQFPIPGNRYEVTITASKDNQQKLSQIMLHQR